MTETYEWQPERKAKYKRRSLVGAIVQGLTLLAYFGYSMFTHHASLIAWIIGCVYILGLGWFSLYQIKEFGLIADGYKLTIGDNGIRLQCHKVTDHIVPFEHIRAVRNESRGLRVVDKTDGFKNLFISNSFEKFEEIKAVLEDKGLSILTY